MKTPPKLLVDSMSAAQFFGYAAEVLKLQPPHLTDQPILAQLAEWASSWVRASNRPRPTRRSGKRSRRRRPTRRRLMAWKSNSLARVVNGWSMNTDTMGVYGNYYLKRAIVAQFGLGANLPEDAIYPLNLVDDTGQALDGANPYAIHFAKSDLPPAGAFWSITSMIPGIPDRQSAEPIRPKQLDAVRLQWRRVAGPVLPARQSGVRQGGELAAGTDGPFNLTMRLYAPRSEALTGRWNPPPVSKGAVIPGLSVQ